jgi:hypothetical protein
MPFALIPDGFSLVKVTKAQEKAVKDFRRSEYIKELLDNETTLPVLLGPVLVPIITIAIAEILKDIESPDLDGEGIKRATDRILEFLQFKRKEASAPVGSGIQTGGTRPSEVAEDFIWLDLLTKNPFFGFKPPERRQTPIRRES